MKIAQIAPLAESVPPKLYGGTERVVSYLTEELVRLGHDVTLFASADSETSGELLACAPRALRLDPALKDVLAPQAHQLALVYKHAHEFDVLHFHIAHLHLPLFRPLARKTVTTLHGRLDLPELAPLYREFADMPLVSISNAQRRPLAFANWMGTVYHGLAREVCPFNPAPRGGYFAFLGRVSPEKGLERAIEIALGLEESSISSDTALDVHDGVAGALLGLLALWEERREPWILERAVGCGERLLATRDAAGGWREDSGLARLGFAHGASGMARALAALARATGDGRYSEAARLGFESERGAYDGERGDWPVLWREPQSGAVRRSWMTAWCRGAAGAALARGLAAPEGVDPASVAELAAAIATLQRAAPAPVDHLCCGALGRAAVLSDLAQRYEQPRLAAAARELARTAWSRAAERGGWELGPAGEAPAGEWALLKGLAGVGWQLLALEDRSILPSLIALEAPSERELRLRGADPAPAPAEDPLSAAEETPAGSAGVAIVRLDPTAAPAFAAMTFPVYRHLLSLRPGARHPEQGDSRPVQPLALGALAGDQPAGLLLLEMPLGDARPPEILSVFVAPEFRRRGVAAALVEAAEAEIERRGFGALEAVYTTGRPGSAIAEHLLDRRGWAAPETRTVLVQIVPREFLASSLLEPARVEALDPGFEYFAWAELDPAERQELIDSDARRPWVTKGLWAWKYDTEGFDLATSLGVRWRGEIVGWVISQRIDATSVRYLASFLRKDLSRRSRILPLYRESLSRGVRDGVELATWVTPMLYPSMIRFIQRWMAPNARLVAETRGRKRIFAPRLTVAGSGD